MTSERVLMVFNGLQNYTYTQCYMAISGFEER